MWCNFSLQGFEDLCLFFFLTPMYSIEPLLYPDNEIIKVKLVCRRLIEQQKQLL